MIMSSRKLCYSMIMAIRLEALRARRIRSPGGDTTPVSGELYDTVANC